MIGGYNQQAPSLSVAQTLEKMSNVDKDFRYMALNDLAKALEAKPRTLRLDDDAEGRLITGLMARLDDISGDVQSLAVRCLAALCETLSAKPAHQLVGGLTRVIVGSVIADKTGVGKARGKGTNERSANSDPSIDPSVPATGPRLDIHSIALRTALEHLSPDAGSEAFASAAGALGNVVACETDGRDEAPQRESLDLLCGLLVRYGSGIDDRVRDSLSRTLLALLSSPSETIRRRSSACLGAVVSHLSDAGLDTVVAGVIDIMGSSEPSKTVSALHSLTAAFRRAGSRMGPRVPGILPHVMGMLDGGGAAEEGTVTEAALLLLDSIAASCPAEGSRHAGPIARAGLRLVGHDPNYNHDFDGDATMDDAASSGSGGDGNGSDDDGDDDDDEEDEFSDDGDDFSDDGDDSWRVRRAALRLLRTASGLARSGLNSSSSSGAGATDADNAERASIPSLVLTEVAARFDREREENVLLDAVCPVLTSLLSAAVREPFGTAEAEVSEALRRFLRVWRRRFSEATAVLVKHRGASGGSAQVQRSKRTRDVLTSSLTAVAVACGDGMGVAAAAGNDSTMDDGTKGAVWDVSVAEIPSTMRRLGKGLSVGEGGGRAAIVAAIRAALATWRHDALGGFTAHCAGPVTECIPDPFYKLSAEALRCTADALSLGGTCGDNSGDAPRALVLSTDLLSRSDVDHEVKEASLQCVGAHLARGHGGPDHLRVLAQRAGHEMLRLPAARAIGAVASAIAHGNSGIDGSNGGNNATRWHAESFASDVLPQVAGLLRQSDRSLRVAAATCLADAVAVVSRGGARVDDGTLANVLSEAGRLVSTADLHLACQALRLIGASAAVPGESTSLSSIPSSATAMEQCIAALFDLLRSPGGSGGSVRDVASDAVANIARHWGTAADAFGVKLSERLESLALEDNESTNAGWSSTALPVVADCLAKAIVGCPGDNSARASSLVAKHTSLLEKAPADATPLPSLYLVGSLVRHTSAATPPSLPPLLLSLLSGSPHAREASGWCLGTVGAGDPATVVPVLRGAQGGGEARVGVLRGVREIVATTGAGASTGSVAQYAPDLLALLTTPPPSDPRETALAAECMGLLAVQCPGVVFDVIDEALAAGANGADHPLLSTSLSALKITLSGGRASSSRELTQRQRQAIPRVLVLMGHRDHVVRRSAVVAVTCAARFAPRLLSTSSSSSSSNGASGGSGAGGSSSGANGPTLASSLPLLFAEVDVDESLIRTVNLGPFEHRVDDGAEGRRCAVECIDALAQAAGAGTVAIGAEGYAGMARALGVVAALDKDLDIRIAAHRTIERHCGGGIGGAGGASDYGTSRPANGSGVAPPLLTALIAESTAVSTQLRKSLLRPLKDTAPEQERIKRDDLIRSACGALASLTSPSGGGASSAFGQLVRDVVLGNDRMSAWFKAAGGEI